MVNNSDPWIGVTRPELADMIDALGRWHAAMTAQRSIDSLARGNYRELLAATIRADQDLLGAYDAWLRAVERSGPEEEDHESQR